MQLFLQGGFAERCENGWQAAAFPRATELGGEEVAFEGKLSLTLSVISPDPPLPVSPLLTLLWDSEMLCVAGLGNRESPEDTGAGPRDGRFTLPWGSCPL